LEYFELLTEGPAWIKIFINFCPEYTVADNFKKVARDTEALGDKKSTRRPIVYIKKYICILGGALNSKKPSA
jgi:hypothetical protein